MAMSNDKYTSMEKYRIRERIVERQSMRAVADGKTIREYSSQVSIEREGDTSEERIRVEYRSDRRNYLDNEYFSLDLGISILNNIEENNISGYIDRFSIDLQNRRNLRYRLTERTSLSDIDSRRFYVQLDRAIRNPENLDKVLNNVVQEVLRDLRRISRIRVEDRDSSIF